MEDYKEIKLTQKSLTNKLRKRIGLEPDYIMITSVSEFLEFRDNLLCCKKK